MADEPYKHKLDPKVIEELAFKGHSLNQIAAQLKISQRYFYELKKQNPWIDEVVAHGRSRAIDFAESRMFKLMSSNDENVAFKANKFFLETKGNWIREVNINVTPRPVVIKRTSGEVVELTVEGENASSD